MKIMDNMFTGVGNVLEVAIKKEHAFFLVNIHAYIINLKTLQSAY